MCDLPRCNVCTINSMLSIFVIHQTYLTEMSIHLNFIALNKFMTLRYMHLYLQNELSSGRHRGILKYYGIRNNGNLYKVFDGCVTSENCSFFNAFVCKFEIKVTLHLSSQYIILYVYLCHKYLIFKLKKINKLLTSRRIT